MEELLAAHAGAGRFLEPDPAGAAGAKWPGAGDGKEATLDYGPDGATGTFTGPAFANDDASRSSDPVAIPGYQIESELARRHERCVPGDSSGPEPSRGGEGADRWAVRQPDSADARFLLEAESVAALEHPHIVRVFAFGNTGGHPYLVMEFVPGGTLAERIGQSGTLSARRHGTGGEAGFCGGARALARGGPPGRQAAQRAAGR